MKLLDELMALEAQALPSPWDDALVNVEIDGHTHTASYGDDNALLCLKLRNSLPAIARRMRLLEGVAAAVQQLDLAYARQDRDIDGYVQRVRDTLKPLKEGGYGRD